MLRIVSFLCLALAPLAYSQYYVASTVAGNGQVQLQGLGGPATSATLISPQAVALDAAGNVFVTDGYYHQVYRISTTGTLSLIAGNGRQGFSGDGGAASAAQLDGPAGLAVDSAGNVFISDGANG